MSNLVEIVQQGEVELMGIAAEGRPRHLDGSPL
jgi:hypothetical protein